MAQDKRPNMFRGAGMIVVWALFFLSPGLGMAREGQVGVGVAVIVLGLAACAFVAQDEIRWAWRRWTGN